jgi:very-short-patch-repair endonuclease
VVSHPGDNMLAMFSNADRELAEVAARQHSIFTRADAEAVELTDDAIDYRVTNFWVRIHEGVYRMPGAPESWKGRLLAACRTATDPAGISHRSGGALYELPGGRDDLVELTCKRWRRAKSSGLVVHEQNRIDERDIAEVDGIPVMKPELVVLQLAGRRPVPTYVEAVIQAARRKRLITYESTREVFDRHARRGVRGVQVMRAVLNAWDPTLRPTESDMETLLIQTLSAGGWPRPVPQYEIFDRDGLFVARVDAALPEHRIAIEYDSIQEHSDEFQRTRDARRRNRIVSAHWRVLSARHLDLKNGGAELLDSIAETARSA